MRIACLHTAAAHEQTFMTLFAQHAPDIPIISVVRDDLLAQAQIGGIDQVADPMMQALGGLASADAVLCTCSTLGPLIDTVQSSKFIRIDRPMMAAAVALGHRPLLAYCLESTRDGSLALLMEEGGTDMQPTVHQCDDAWGYFATGDLDGYADAIVTSLAPVVGGHDCIILAQASMDVARPMLEGLGIPVLSSPELAVAHTIAVARS